MKALILMTLLLSAAAWVSLQGEPRATATVPSEVPAAPEPPLPVTRSSAPVLANPKPAPKKPPSALEAAIETGDVCATARLISSVSDAKQMFETYLAATGAGAEALEIFGPNGPYFSEAKTDQKFRSVAARSLWALRLGGLAFTNVTAPIDRAAALAMLTELGKKNPGNGFYPLFRLSLESKLGYGPEKLLATADEVANSTSFTSPIDAATDELRVGSWANPATRYAYNYFFFSSFVNYYPAVQALKAVEGFSGKARVAQLLTEAGLHSTSRSWDLDFDVTRYSLGRNLDPDAHYPPLNELRAERGDSTSYGPTVPGAAADCDPAPYENFFFDQREAR